jgi:hypothetical protein
MRNITFVYKASIASSKDPLYFESLSNVALLLQPNRALHWLWILVHLNPTVGLPVLVFQVIDILCKQSAKDHP